MVFGWFQRKTDRAEHATVERMYAAIMAQTRLPTFYLPPYGVDDTFEGRFEVLALNAYFPLSRLAEMAGPGSQLAQRLSNSIFSHLDDALREMGVSDVGVPKKMKKLASAFLGRGQAYDAALRQSDGTALAEALSRNIYGGARDGEALAHYVQAAQTAFKAAQLETLMRGEFPYPVPDTRAGAADRGF